MALVSDARLMLKVALVFELSLLWPSFKRLG